MLLSLPFLKRSMGDCHDPCSGSHGSGSHGSLTFGLDGRLRHADCKSGRQPITAPGAGLQPHSYVALGLEGGQQVAFEQQHALAAGAADVLTQPIPESEGGGISLWYPHTGSHLELCSLRRAPPQRQSAGHPGNRRERNPSNRGNVIRLLHP